MQINYKLLSCSFKTGPKPEPDTFSCSHKLLHPKKVDCGCSHRWIPWNPEPRSLPLNTRKWHSVRDYETNGEIFFNCFVNFGSLQRTVLSKTESTVFHLYFNLHGRNERWISTRKEKDTGRPKNFENGKREWDILYGVGRRHEKKEVRERFKTG